MLVNGMFVDPETNVYDLFAQLRREVRLRSPSSAIMRYVLCTCKSSAKYPQGFASSAQHMTFRIQEVQAKEHSAHLRAQQQHAQSCFVRPAALQTQANCNAIISSILQ